MADNDALAFNRFIEAQAKALRARDVPPAGRRDWQDRRERLRAAMFAAMGPAPEKPCPLEARTVGALKRTGYRIEKVVFQTRPDVWMTANAYVPDPARGKLPAVLAVHGHWAEGRRSPVVQARCLGLVQLGFFVLAVDAFGAGERHPANPRGGYHGALIGSALWPAGLTLLGVQAYENRRAVDYLLSRPEVDGDRLGITGASGGGNQTMYAGALDERFKAVVPVCSVGTYRAYVRAACCVCEVLPGALRFTEEGDVLGLVAPRALMVVSATKDAFQFSVGEAAKSVARARTIFQLYGAEERLAHTIIESGHDYNQAMREAMYGWMTRWLKGEGAGKPLAEPKHRVESIDDLACFPDGKRPAAFLFPAGLAAREGRRLLTSWQGPKLDHLQAWEAAAVAARARLRDLLGPFPKAPPPEAELGVAESKDGARTVPLTLRPEPDLPLPVLVRFRTGAKGKLPACLLLHLEGKGEALKHPLAAALVERGWVVVAPDLRATGATRPEHDAIAGAPDHNSAEHSLWVGRPLLGQWAFDVQCLLDWMARQPGYRADRLAVVGLGQAGLVALVVGGLLEERVASVAAVEAPATLVTEQAYGTGFRMGLLAPGLLRAGDVPHLAALVAPRKLAIWGGATPQLKPLAARPFADAFAFTRRAYALAKAADRLDLRPGGAAADLAALL